jgi:serine phosphatase RsbU (regulator of sigma subunit)
MLEPSFDSEAELSLLKRQLAQREAELQIINGVQQALAADLDMQAIYDMVGNKIRDVFDAQGIQLCTFDHQNNMMRRHYIEERGQRLYVDPIPITPIWQSFIRGGRTSLVGDLSALLRRIDPSFAPPIGETPLSSLTVPLISKGEMYGAINLSNLDHVNAFDEADARLLETIANSMSLALENARLFGETQHLLKESEQRAAELQIINNVQQGLAARLGVQAIYDLVGDKIRDIFHAQVVMISTYDRNAQTIEHRYAIERGERIYAPGHHPIRGFRIQVVETRQPVLVSSNVAELAAQLGQPTLPGTLTPKTWLGVPLIVEDQVTGILSLQDVERENAFGDSVVRLLQTLANAMSVALENAQLWEQEHLYREALEHEFEIGRDIQAGFLPAALPQFSGWEIAASLKSAREVAGDFYDIFELPNERVGLVIADVCDKGLGAALFMTLFRSLLRAVSNIDFYARDDAGNLSSPSARLKHALLLTNNYIAETHGKTGMFATVFFGILDLSTGQLTYINGGHLPPILLGGNGVKQILNLTGPAVGVLPDAEYRIRQVKIERGDLLFAYTDGLTDTENPAGEVFPIKHLFPSLHGSQSVSALLDQIQKQVEAHAAGVKQSDDITMLVLRRTPNFA